MHLENRIRKIVLEEMSRLLDAAKPVERQGNVTQAVAPAEESLSDNHEQKIQDDLLQEAIVAVIKVIEECESVRGDNRVVEALQKLKEVRSSQNLRNYGRSKTAGEGAFTIYLGYDTDVWEQLTKIVQQYRRPDSINPKTLNNEPIIEFVWNEPKAKEKS